MCPALDVRQPVINKKRKEYNSHTNLRSKKKKLGPSNLKYRGVGDKPMSCKPGVAGSIPGFS